MIQKLLIFMLLLSLVSCNESQIGTPKPRMFPKVVYPERTIVEFNENYCNIKFKYPDYFSVKQDKYFFDEEVINPCWFDLYSETLNTQLHCSYIPIDDRNHFDKLISDAFKLTGKHNQKANYRKEQFIENEKEKVYGLLFELDGPVASPLQFFVTDSTHHFFRGSLYFNSQVNRDSIAPIYEFVKSDVELMIERFRWN